MSITWLLCRPSGIVVSGADCYAVGTRFESRRRHGCLYLYSLHGGTLNSRRAASPLVRLVKEEERWKAPDQNWGETELNRSVTCMVLKATAIDRRHLAFAVRNFMGLDLAFADQVALATTTWLQ
ncbi:uncharacterized protein TNCV_261511 [Trichonephila clavipes]|nr:uncharacterized protein TNCV_261511 [Trichonephila clavipes]